MSMIARLRSRLPEGRPRRIIPLVVLLAIVIIGGVWLWTNVIFPSSASGIFASGFIEATDVSIAPEISGRIVSIAVAEGDEARASQPLVRLDDALLKAQQRQAEAGLKSAQAGLEQAKASRDGARKAWEDAQDVQKNPLELEARLVAAQAQVDSAKYSLAQATDNFRKITYPYTYTTFALDIPGALGYIDSATRYLADVQAALQPEAGPDQYAAASQDVKRALDSLTSAQEQLARGQGADVFTEGFLNVRDFWTLRAAQIQMEQARSSLETATRTLQIVQEIRGNPQELNAAVDKARAAYDMAIAIVAAAEGQVELAQASLEVIRVQLGRTVLTSPVTGVVAARNAEVGELAQAGAPILVVTRLEEVTLTGYVAENKIGLVKLGQEAQVSVDSYPGMSFEGRVVYISPRAQFTPKNIQVQEEREKTVFAVKIRLANPDQKLKPGMPADATIVIP